jgi:hypothetical protein
MKSEQFPAHGGAWKAEFDVALDTTQQSGVIVFEKGKTF